MCHGIGIVINRSVIIGNNVILKLDVITIEDTRISDNTKIGTDDIVTINIPSKSVAVGVPAQVIKEIVL